MSGYYRIWPTDESPRTYEHIEDIKSDLSEGEVRDSAISYVMGGAAVGYLNSDKIADELFKDVI